MASLRKVAREAFSVVSQQLTVIREVVMLNEVKHLAGRYRKA